MKSIIFDFDGTLTQRDQNIWKMIWKALGYPVDKSSDYARLYVDCVINKKITRKQWFDETCMFLKKKNLTKNIFDSINKDIYMIDGCEKTLMELRRRGYHLVILSGSITDSIKSVLGDSYELFDMIESNNVVFDDFGKLTRLDPTPFDYEGKSFFINNYIKYTKSRPQDILFIGNSDNDEFVYRSGVKTICINPTSLADVENGNKWHTVIKNVSNLQQIIPVITKLDACNSCDKSSQME